ncbi:MAG: archease [Candidatus Omnitrophica bacterium]|nr:archease [Candidatus Omnitrophota bacterium]
MKSSCKKYELFDHTADAGLKAYGKDISQLFQHAAEGLAEILLYKKEVNTDKKVKIKVEAKTLEDLFVFWLEEVLYQMQVKRVILKKFKITEFLPDAITAVAEGEDYDPKRHHLKTEIKAVTYHNLKIEKKDSVWQAEVIFDI